MSTPTAPCSSVMRSTAATIESSSVTSSTIVVMPSACRGLRASALLAVAYTGQPARCSLSATVWPVPEEKPVLEAAPVSSTARDAVIGSVSYRGRGGRTSTCASPSGVGGDFLLRDAALPHRGAKTDRVDETVDEVEQRRIEHRLQDLRPGPSGGLHPVPVGIDVLVRLVAHPGAQ